MKPIMVLAKVLAKMPENFVPEKLSSYVMERLQSELATAKQDVLRANWKKVMLEEKLKKLKAEQQQKETS